MRMRINRWHIAIAAITTEILAFIAWRLARRHRAAAEQL
jgi:chromatin segregation and condensation protein Rec8/ScpA/Scc1 (kleisin family)